jgi:methyl-accepting chemotaxis protein
VADSLTAAADQTTHAADHLSVTSRFLAEGATEQASSLEETSASLEELSSTTASNADHAKQVNDLSSAASAAVDLGLQDTRSLYSAMASLRKSCDEIANIVRSIDAIAFQTNLLALNAAVEAARAGAAGQGFSVVAEEVRALAQRSAAASRETSERIEAVLTSSTSAIEISGRVEKTLADIAGRVREVHQAATAVATSSRQQAEGIRHINQAVSQVELVTQKSVANAEESAAGAEELHAQSAGMRQSVGELLRLVEGAMLETSRGASPSCASDSRSGGKDHCERFARTQGLSPGRNGSRLRGVAAANRR